MVWSTFLYRPEIVKRSTCFVNQIPRRWRTVSNYHQQRKQIVAKPLNTGDLEFCDNFEQNTSDFVLKYKNCSEINNVPSNLRKLFTLAFHDFEAHREFYSNEMTKRVKQSTSDQESLQYRIAVHTANIRVNSELYARKPYLKGLYFRVLEDNECRRKLLDQLNQENCDEYEYVKNALKIEHIPELLGPIAEVDCKYLTRVSHNDQCSRLIEAKKEKYRVETEEKLKQFWIDSKTNFESITAEIENIENELKIICNEQLAAQT